MSRAAAPGPGSFRTWREMEAASAAPPREPLAPRPGASTSHSLLLGPSSGQTPGAPPPRPGAPDGAGAAPWPLEFSEGFRGAPASESPAGLKSSEAGAPPGTRDSEPAAGARERAFGRAAPGGAQRARPTLGSARGGLGRFLRWRPAPGVPRRGSQPCVRRLPPEWPRRGWAPGEGTALIPEPPRPRSAPAGNPRRLSFPGGPRSGALF